MPGAAGVPAARHRPSRRRALASPLGLLRGGGPGIRRRGRGARCRRLVLDPGHTGQQVVRAEGRLHLPDPDLPGRRPLAGPGPPHRHAVRQGGLAALQHGHAGPARHREGLLGGRHGRLGGAAGAGGLLPAAPRDPVLQRRHPDLQGPWLQDARWHPMRHGLEYAPRFRLLREEEAEVRHALYEPQEPRDGAAARHRGPPRGAGGEPPARRRRRVQRCGHRRDPEVADERLGRQAEPAQGGLAEEPGLQGKR
mmetsp:Transcript_39633/g.110212  ORF Transcript_39633/g.110212 Transcript_39633/m.110212 type:complete len:252 (+) Transcript_39633:2867-3622(+)